MAASSSSEPAGLPPALALFRAFPEASSYHILILDADKRAVVSLPQASRDMVHQNLRLWLQRPNVHVFVRPHMANLVVLDADNYAGDMQTIFALKPRCVTETSPRNYQVWLTLGHRLAGKAALEVTKGLTRALGADMASAKTTQVGRLLNIKRGKGNQVLLLHSFLQDMDEQVYLRLVPDPAFDAAPDVRQMPARQHPGGRDRSRLDWAGCPT